MWRVMDRQNNRRKLKRVNVSFDVHIYVSRWYSWMQRPVIGKVVDFNRYGVAVRCDKQVTPGTSLSVDLFAPDMTLRAVRVNVVYCQKTDQGDYRLGLRTYINLRQLSEHDPRDQIRYLAGLEHELLTR